MDLPDLQELHLLPVLSKHRTHMDLPGLQELHLLKALTGHLRLSLLTDPAHLIAQARPARPAVPLPAMALLSSNPATAPLSRLPATVPLSKLPATVPLSRLLAMVPLSSLPVMAAAPPVTTTHTDVHLKRS